MDASETAFTNPFFYTVPPGTFVFSLIIAVLAAIVASQAMITSSFQLLSQVMRMSYFPHIKVVHTSKKFHEQVYIPMANWLLMIGTVGECFLPPNSLDCQSRLSQDQVLTRSCL